MRKILLLLIPMLTVSCDFSYEKENISYGKQVFSAGYDGLLATDYLYLYDNEIFRISISECKGNGSYKMETDTLILNYYESNDKLPQAYLLEKESRWIEVYEQRDGRWKKKENTDAGLMIYKNYLSNLSNKN